MEPTTEICAHCGGESARHGDVCPACGHDPRLIGGTHSYRLVRRLGHGANGTTFAAERESDAQPLAVKELLVRRLEDFKAHDLFTREAGVLRSLENHAIPRYHDDFAFGEGRHLGLYLVTELINGATLEAEMKSRRHTQKEVLGIIRELCDVLVYLHGFAPPVVHRDIKASNVMRRGSDQSLVLIDFGAVKDSIRQPGDGSTVAGTFGYMPPEQLAGRAGPASDIYALGVLCVVLLTRAQPHELVDEQNRLQWREHVASEPLRQLLSHMLENDPKRRLADAAEVARRIDDILAGRAVVARDPLQTGGASFNRGQVQREVIQQALGGFGAMGQRFAGMIGDMVTTSTPGVADPPPDSPREIPSGFAGRAEPIANFMRWFGVFFGGMPFVMGAGFLSFGVGGFIMLFSVIGIAMAGWGFSRIARAKRLFKNGEAAPAIVTDAWLNTSVRVNGRSPFKITFRYETPDGQQHSATVSRFRMPPDLRVPGAQVYALYDKQNPSQATLWPV